MPLRNSFKYQDIAKLLEYYGCHLLQEWKGSHKKWHSPLTRKHFPIPVHWNKELREGTLFAILKQAGISKENVLNYLNKKK